mmetsp:Transcript_124166/g.397389  ORF Transcript_124166/g.397389 Transcript_124166/m.397389 type:complete len:94 (+) Transcript_124166:599-880(+)
MPLDEPRCRLFGGYGLRSAFGKPCAPPDDRCPALFAHCKLCFEAETSCEPPFVLGVRLCALHCLEILFDPPLDPVCALCSTLRPSYRASFSRH